jgi:hypothetical protein
MTDETDESEGFEIFTDFLEATNVKAMPINAITSNGSEVLVMLEVAGRTGEGVEGVARIVITKETAETMRTNLAGTIERWGQW